MENQTNLRNRKSKLYFNLDHFKSDNCNESQDGVNEQNYSKHTYDPVVTFNSNLVGKQIKTSTVSVDTAIKKLKTNKEFIKGPKNWEFDLVNVSITTQSLNPINYNAKSLNIMNRSTKNTNHNFTGVGALPYNIHTHTHSKAPDFTLDSYEKKYLKFKNKNETAMPKDYVDINKSIDIKKSAENQLNNSNFLLKSKEAICDHYHEDYGKVDLSDTCVSLWKAKKFNKYYHKEQPRLKIELHDQYLIMNKNKVLRQTMKNRYSEIDSEKENENSLEVANLDAKIDLNNHKNFKEDKMIYEVKKVSFELDGSRGMGTNLNLQSQLNSSPNKKKSYLENDETKSNLKLDGEDKSFVRSFVSDLFINNTINKNKDLVVNLDTTQKANKSNLDSPKNEDDVNMKSVYNFVDNLFAKSQKSNQYEQNKDKLAQLNFSFEIVNYNSTIRDLNKNELQNIQIHNREANNINDKTININNETIIDKEQKIINESDQKQSDNNRIETKTEISINSNVKTNETNENTENKQPNIKIKVENFVSSLFSNENNGFEIISKETNKNELEIEMDSFTIQQNKSSKSEINDFSEKENTKVEVSSEQVIENDFSLINKRSNDKVSDKEQHNNLSERKRILSSENDKEDNILSDIFSTVIKRVSNNDKKSSFKTENKKKEKNQISHENITEINPLTKNRKDTVNSLDILFDPSTLNTHHDDSENDPNKSQVNNFVLDIFNSIDTKKPKQEKARDETPHETYTNELGLENKNSFMKSRLKTNQLLTNKLDNKKNDYVNNLNNLYEMTNNEREIIIDHTDEVLLYNKDIERLDTIGDIKATTKQDQSNLLIDNLNDDIYLKLNDSGRKEKDLKSERDIYLQLDKVNLDSNRKQQNDSEKFVSDNSKKSSRKKNPHNLKLTHKDIFIPFSNLEENEDVSQTGITNNNSFSNEIELLKKDGFFLNIDKVDKLNEDKDVNLINGKTHVEDIYLSSHSNFEKEDESKYKINNDSFTNDEYLKIEKLNDIELDFNHRENPEINKQQKEDPNSVRETGEVNITPNIIFSNLRKPYVKTLNNQKFNLKAQQHAKNLEFYEENFDKNAHRDFSHIPENFNIKKLNESIITNENMSIICHSNNHDKPDLNMINGGFEYIVDHKDPISLNMSNEGDLMLSANKNNKSINFSENFEIKSQINTVDRKFEISNNSDSYEYISKKEKNPTNIKPNNENDSILSGNVIKEVSAKNNYNFAKLYDVTKFLTKSEKNQIKVNKSQDDLSREKHNKKDCKIITNQTHTSQKRGEDEERRNNELNYTDLLDKFKKGIIVPINNSEDQLDSERLNNKFKNIKNLAIAKNREHPLDIATRNDEFSRDNIIAGKNSDFEFRKNLPTKKRNKSQKLNNEKVPVSKREKEKRYVSDDEMVLHDSKNSHCDHDNLQRYSFIKEELMDLDNKLHHKKRDFESRYKKLTDCGNHFSSVFNNLIQKNKNGRNISDISNANTSLNMTTPGTKSTGNLFRSDVGKHLVKQKNLKIMQTNNLPDLLSATKKVSDKYDMNKKTIHSIKILYERYLDHLVEIAKMNNIDYPKINLKYTRFETLNDIMLLNQLINEYKLSLPDNFCKFSCKVCNDFHVKQNQIEFDPNKTGKLFFNLKEKKELIKTTPHINSEITKILACSYVTKHHKIPLPSKTKYIPQNLKRCLIYPTNEI